MSEQDEGAPLTIEQQIKTEMALCTQYGFKQHPCYDKEGKCQICLEEIKGSYVLETPCGHFFDCYCLIYTVLYKLYYCPECQMKYKKIDF